jgi:CheY-like chemotaxis protein
VLSTTLVRQMLNLTRTGHAHLAFVRLGETVSEALKLVRAGLPKTIEIQVENLALDDQVMVDTIHLQQVVMNLATNAAHAMSGKPGGCIRVTIRETPLPCADDYPETLSLAPGTYLRLSFSDNGHGIPAELLGKVFDPFFTTKPIGSGTGLGLPVAQAFASRHGGAIGVKSAPGEGATFTLHLPKKCAPKYEPRLAGIQGLRLLLVDDDAHGREAMAEGLRRASHSVTEAMGGSSALRLFEEDPEGFDAVITDQIMPGMTGLDLAEQVHCLAPRVPVFLISGYQGTLAPGALEAKGILRVFPKPVTLAELDRAIREAQLER